MRLRIAYKQQKGSAEGEASVKGLTILPDGSTEPIVVIRAGELAAVPALRTLLAAAVDKGYPDRVLDQMKVHVNEVVRYQNEYGAFAPQEANLVRLGEEPAEPKKAPGPKEPPKTKKKKAPKKKAKPGKSKDGFN